MGRASGGQVTLIGRHGGNAFHGALYEFLQNNDNKRAGLANAICASTFDVGQRPALPLRRK